MRFSASQPRCGCTCAKSRCRATQAASLGPLHGGKPSAARRVAKEDQALAEYVHRGESDRDEDRQARPG